jgi:hypothetical protein
LLAGKCTGSILGLALPWVTREDKQRGTVINDYVPNSAFPVKGYNHKLTPETKIWFTLKVQKQKGF